jgi:hypothetical protein
MLRQLTIFVAAACLSFLLSVPAQATILTFDIFNPIYSGTEDYPEGFGVNQAYGDRVTSTAGSGGGDTFGYGEAGEGFTPNVVANYGPFTLLDVNGGPQLWRYDYGDLERVLYQGSAGPIGTDYDILDIELIADSGYEVQLFGFDLGGWPRTDYEINEVVVFDGIPFPFLTPMNQIFSETGVVVHGDLEGPPHTTFTFGTPLQSDRIFIRIDANNLGPDSINIGIDNIRFGQVRVVEPVPEPISLVTWLLGGSIGAALYARRRKSVATAL